MNQSDKNTDAPQSDITQASESTDFIRTRINEDNLNGRFDARVHTRFPPEPNGYLHIGHAKSICLNFGIANDYNGLCNLRFDDTNPVKEDIEYVDSIKEDVMWLGFKWHENAHYASDYFDQLYKLAMQLIEIGKAYIDELSADDIREYRGTLTEHGKNSPYRDRPISENIDLFTRMKNGDFPDGAMVLRAKINMASPNMIMRDPTIYRIRHAHHHKTGDKWHIYPMYDFTHCISDSIENITHSICTLEFENNRELYDWVLDTLNLYHPQQIEFARLNLTHTLLSKRKLIQLVQNNLVNGWDDPRMPTISGMRRRGYPPEAIRNFCSKIGVARASDSVVDYELLEFCVREQLNQSTPRLMAVLNPIKVIIENYPENQEEFFEAPLHPEKPEYGTRKVPFSREIYIERDDFMEIPARKYFRLAPNAEVRLRYAYYITCKNIIKDAEGNIIEIICTYDPETKGGQSPDGRKVKGTIHFVSKKHAVTIETRIYEHLLITPPDNTNSEANSTSSQNDNTSSTNTNTAITEDFPHLNPNSLIISQAFAEPHVSNLNIGEQIQFERIAYFTVDKDSTTHMKVLNRTVTLKDSWGKTHKS